MKSDFPLNTQGLAALDLGVIDYPSAFTRQQAELDALLRDRESSPRIGTILALEHTPVITISNRPGAGDHLLASVDVLAAMGVALERTDRGGDITYHGPGQLILYPIVDLNRLKLGIHDYMRLLEETVIRTLADFGIAGDRDASATGVWVRTSPDTPTAKIAAMGVRVRRWASMHGLSLNVNPNLAHFNLIVPCGLAGRPVTSLTMLKPDNTPTMADVKARAISHLDRLIAERVAVAQSA